MQQTDIIKTDNCTIRMYLGDCMDIVDQIIKNDCILKKVFVYCTQKPTINK